MEAALNNIIKNPAYHDILSIVKGTRAGGPGVRDDVVLLADQYADYYAVPRRTGARNGLVYGVKVRFPHALVMSILFQSGE